MAEASGTGKRARKVLTRERVLEGALELADRQGITGLSMRSLARALGVEAMSLYNHIGGKDDLLDGMVETVVARIALPRSGEGWKEAMRRRAVSAHDEFLRHPWAPLLIVSRVNVGPAMLRYIDATLGCLREAGFSYEMADHACNAVDSHVYGFTLQQLNFPLEPGSYRQAASDFMPNLEAERYPHMRALAESVADGRYSGLNDFEFGLGIILDGLERLIRRS